MPTALLVAALVGFVVWFFGLWCGIVWLISFGGWRRLAARYRSDAPAPPGEQFAGASGYVGRSRYRQALTVTVGAEGLHLTVSRLFALGHPPLRIPWADLEEAPLTGRLAAAGAAFQVGGPTGVRLVFERGGAAGAIAAVLAHLRSGS